MKLNDEYLQILADLDGDEDGRHAAWDYLLTSTNIYRGHVVACDYFPKFFDQRLRDYLMDFTATTYAILVKVMDRYLADPDYRDVYDFDPRLVDLILTDRGYPSYVPFSRIDLFMDEDTLQSKYCEFNADGSSGMNENREAENAMVLGDTFKRFAANHTITSMNPVMLKGWVQEFLRIYRTWTAPVERPHVALVDYLENSVLEEFKLYRRLFEEAGVPCSIYDARTLAFDGEALTGAEPYEGLGHPGLPINAIWRRAVTNDVLDNYDASLPFLEAFKQGKVCLIGSFLTQLIHDKQVFTALRHPKTRAFLTPEENAFVDAAIPKTVYLGADSIDLDMVKADPVKWILKPTDGYGCRDVFPGPSYNAEEWATLVDTYADSKTGTPFLVQEFVTPYKTPSIPLRGDECNYTDAPQPYNNLTGCYMIDGKLAGIFSRIGPSPLILGRCGGLTAPSFWVDCPSPFQEA